jgi:pilus assembly protein CpaC
MHPIKSLLAGTLLLAAALPGASTAQNMMGVNITNGGEAVNSKTLRLPLNKSAVVELGHPAADVIISSPEVADVFVQTSKRFIFHGRQPGSTNAFIFDEQGNQLLNLEIIVERDVAELETLIADIVPDARVKVKGAEGSVVLSGRVANMAEADSVLQIAESYMNAITGGGGEVVNLLTVDANDQVMLQVRVVEMRRNVAKQLGVDVDFNTYTFGEIGDDDLATVLANSTTPLGIGSGLDLGLSYSNFAGNDVNVDVALEALEGVGVVRTLAEPNLTTVSGESANFLAGGEFPVPSEVDDQGRVQVTFREFGVGLGFTPFVLTEDRISLRMSLEVSEISPEIAVGNTPGLTSRKVESTVELPSGRSMMIAGLIQSETRQILEGVPGAKDIPYLGALFRSRDFTNDETELVVIVTPYLVGPSNPAELRTPADGFANPSDLEANLFGKLNAIYGTRGRPERGEGYNAPVGFIEE